MGFRERVERRRWTMHIGDVVVEDPGGDAIVLGSIIVVPHNCCDCTVLRVTALPQDADAVGGGSQIDRSRGRSGDRSRASIGSSGRASDGHHRAVSTPHGPKAPGKHANRVGEAITLLLRSQYACMVAISKGVLLREPAAPHHRSLLKSTWGVCRRRTGRRELRLQGKRAR
jgi:hypothetical protein